MKNTYRGFMSDIEYHYGLSSDFELVLAHGVERRYPWHIHVDHWTVGLVLSGTVVLGTKETTLSLGEGAYFIVRPCEAHCLNVAANTSLVTFCVNASKPCANLSDHLQTVLSASDIEKLEMLSRSFVLDTSNAVESPIQNVIRQLLEEPEETFSVTEMASLARFSPWHFLRRFRRQTGMNPHAFQLACRLRRARSLLRSGASAVDAALSAGFADQSHMHKVFKLHHGLTPRQFMKASFTLEP